MTRRSYAGGAASTTLNGAINGSVTSLTVTDGSSYPDGSGGKFAIVIDKGIAGEEKILVTSRTGNTFNGLTRGYDGTAAASHSNLAVVQHCITAVDLDEANAHVNASTAVHGLTGTVVGTSDAQTLSNKTLTAPSIADFTAATHDHSAANKGGNIPESSVTNLVSDLATKAADSAVVHKAGGDTITASAAGVKPLVLKHAASPTVDWLTLQDSTGVARVNVTKDAQLAVRDAGGTAEVTLDPANTVPRVTVIAPTGAGGAGVRVNQGTSNNDALQQLDNSLTTIASLNSTGYFKGGSNALLSHGTLAYVESTTLSQAFTNTATDLPGMTTTPTLQNGHRYRISAGVRLSAGVANDLVAIRIVVDGSAIKEHQILMPVSGGPGATNIEFTVDLVGDGVGHTIKLQGIRNSGSGTDTALGSSTSPAYLRVEHIGQ